MKKKSTISILSIILIVVLLFIPTYIAIASYKKIENTPVNVSEATKMTMSDINGTEYTFEDTSISEKKIIDMFTSLVDSSTRVNELPVDDGTPSYLVNFKVGEEERTYNFYFSKTADSFMVDGTGKVFRLSTATVSSFLSTKYAACLYTASDAPVLRFGDAGVILSEEMEWKYRTAKGAVLTAVDAKALKTTTETQTVESDGSFDFRFSVIPNRTVVTVTDGNGNELYKDSFINQDVSDFSSKLNLTQNSILNVKLESEWNETQELDYSGRAVYRFKVDFAAPAKFEISSLKAVSGSVVMLTAYNAKNTSKISFSSTPELTFRGSKISPVFYSDGVNSRALIMIDYATKEIQYSLTVSYGGVSNTFDLKVEGRTYRTGYTSSVSAAVAELGHSAAALKAFEDQISALIPKSSPKQLWAGRFLNSTGEVSPSYALGFGHYRTITSTGETYQNEGVDYYVAEGSDIVAAADGTVLFTGASEFPGNYIVIDHGLGLFTVYMHMNTFSVSAGSTVKAGDVIGTAGTTGFIAQNGANHSIMYFVNGYAFCGYELEDIGLN